MTIEAQTNVLSKIVQDNDVTLAVGMPIVDAYLPHYEKAVALKEKAASINVTNADDDDGMELARKTRLEFRAARTASDKVRIKEKATYTRMNNAIQGIYNTIAGICEPEEERLQKMEDFAELAKAERKAKLKAEREVLLSPYIGVQTSFHDLANMPEPVFMDLLNGSKLAHEARVVVAAKAEAERVAAEQAKAAEEVRIRAENEKMRKEAEEAAAALAAERKAAADAAEAARVQAAKDAAAAKAKADAEAKAIADKAAAERKELEAKAAAERKAIEDKAAESRRASELLIRKAKDEREKLEKELAAKRADEVRAVAEIARNRDEEIAAEAKRKADAEAAPDKAKLLELAAKLRAFPLPTCTSEDAKAMVAKVAANFINVAGKLEDATK